MILSAMLASCGPDDGGSPLPPVPSGVSGSFTVSTGLFDPDHEVVVACSAALTFHASVAPVDCPDCEYAFHIDDRNAEDGSTSLCDNFWLDLDWDEEDLYLGYAYTYLQYGYGPEYHVVELGWMDDDELYWWVPATGRGWDADRVGDHVTWSSAAEWRDDWGDGDSLTYLSCGNGDHGTDPTAPPPGASVEEDLPFDFYAGDLWQVSLRSGEALVVNVESEDLYRLAVTFIDPDHCWATQAAATDACPTAETCLQRAIVAPADGTWQVEVRRLSYTGETRDYLISAGIDGTAAMLSLVGDDIWVWSPAMEGGMWSFAGEMTLGW